MDPIKEAFIRAKQDINELKQGFVDLSVEINELKSILSDISRHIQTQNQTDRQINKTENIDLNEPLRNNPQFWAEEALKPHIYKVSTRNEGVSTDRPTDQQTDTKPDIFLDNPLISTGKSSKIDQLTNISNLLNSLDTYKKELRTQFKRLTKQEMLVYSSIYQLEEEGFTVDYPLLSKKLSLSESSIRDYVQRITKKNIIVNKIKENNKRILLSIPKEIREMASLQTILQLREI